MREIKRGDIFFATLNPVMGSEQGGIRPVIVLQNDLGNKYSPTTIVAAITSNVEKTKLPTHVLIDKNILPKSSIVLLEQIRTIDKHRLIKFICHLEDSEMSEINQAIAINFALEI